MAEKISIQIALEGGAAVERQLADIGEAGQKAFAEIEKSASQAGGFKNLKPDEVTAKLKEMGVEGTEAFGKIQQAVATAANFEKLVVGIQSVETGLAALARAAVPVGAAIAAAMAVATKATISFAESITKISAEAISLGASFERFDQGRKSLEALGLSAQAISSGFAEVQSNVEKIKLDQVKRDAAELQQALKGGGSAGDSFKRLQDAAEHFTDAGKAAREELLKLNQPIPGIGEGLQRLGDPVQGLRVTMQDVRELGVELAKLKSVGIDIKVGDDAVTQMQKITDALRQMPDSARRTEIALQFLGKPAGTEFIQQLKAAEGSLPPIEANAVKLSGAVNQLQSAFARFGTVSFAPFVTAEVQAATSALQALQNVVENFGWQTFVNGALAAGNALKFLSIGGLASKGLELLAGSANQATQAVQQTGQASGSAAAQMQQLGTGASGLQGLTAAAGSAAAQMQQLGQAGGSAGQQAASGVQVWDEALGRAVPNAQQAGQAATQAGQQAAQGAQQGTSAWERFGTAGDAALAKIGQVASSVASIAWDNISSAGVSAWNALAGAIAGAYDWLLKYIGLRPSAPPVAPSGGGGIGHAAGGGLLGGRGTGTSDSNLAWLSRGEFVIQAAAVRRYGAGLFAALNAQRFADGGQVGGGGQLWGFLDGVTDQLDAALRELTDSLVTHVLNIAKQVETPMHALLGLMNQLPRNARGGLLGGRGSGTSDSNLAWVSRGEYITPARAVAQPGVLAFLEALRRSGGNLSRVLDGMGRFALGGMVPRMPAFAVGGSVGSMSHVTIAFPGLPAIGGLRASSDVVDQLQRAAALAQVRSGGRKPSRYS
jgi:hypothetical protein